MSQFDDVSLLSLPDEILLIILKKLKPADVLFSLVGVNKRLDQIARDRCFTRREIDLTRSSVIDRFSSYILPRIRSDIRWLTVEPVNIERVLLANDYPNLTSLTIIHVDYEAIERYFNDNSPCVRLFKNQVTQLIVKLIDEPGSNLNKILWTSILAMGMSLTKLNITSKSSLNLRQLPLSSFFLPTLFELHLHLRHFTDCLLLFDDRRLPQLQILHVQIDDDRYAGPRMTTEIITPPLNLRTFSLICYFPTTDMCYNEWVVPLLHRMTNLEHLTLWLVLVRSPFITGIHLDQQILAHMSRLQTFKFNIRSSYLDMPNDNLLKKADISDTFPIRLVSQNQVSCSMTNSLATYPTCHIYSLPYTFDRIEGVTYKSFTGELFMSVRSLMLYETSTHPFDHQFLKRVSQSFPLLERLRIAGFCLGPSPSKDGPLFEFPHLTTLVIFNAENDSYAKQFLINTNISLPHLDELQIKPEHLKTITNDFKYEGELSNCFHVTRLYLNKPWQPYMHNRPLLRYFPSLRHVCECQNVSW